MFRPNPTHARSHRQCGIQTNYHLLIQMDIEMAHPLSKFGAVLKPVTVLLFLALFLLDGGKLSAAETILLDTNSTMGYNVRGYVIEGRTVLSTNVLVPLFAKYAGTNITIQQLIRAASDLESEYVREGFPAMNIVISPRHIADGIVTMDVFPGAIAQVIIAGNRYVLPAVAVTNGATVAAMPALTNRPPPPRVFPVKSYMVLGNTLLPPATLAMAITNATAGFGTNVTFDGIRAVATSLQMAYRDRGYVTVSVGIPPQKLVNDTVKLQVVEGRLAHITVSGNYYYSSNNVMRALPGLHTNMILNGLAFQQEVNRANANQDRQIYPVIEPGPDPGTSDLILKVKDRLPLHGKVEFNDMSSPGTPLFRLNTSLAYNNLWNLEHSLGVQYGYSPRYYKTGDQWAFYDRPQVANYGAYYRLPIGGPPDVENIVETKPGSFGYDEATHKFNLPPPSGQPELNVYASRSTIDTGIEQLSSTTLYDVPGVISIKQNNFQQDLTVNSDIGGRLSAPFGATEDFRSDVSGGLDFKNFQTTSYKTNDFLFSEITVNAQGQPNPPINSTVLSPAPTAYHPLNYLPLALNYNASWHDPHVTVSGGLGVSANPWFSGSRSNLDAITESKKSTGHWVILTPGVQVQIPIHTNWITVIRADGQYASEPLISNEQFGAGGVNSVRGYREGEVFGDAGWHVSFEEQTPPHVVGIVYGKTPLVIRGIVYMDYAQTYLLDPQGRENPTDLWGMGFGGVASIGPHWETRFLFSLPLISTTTTEAWDPFFNFALTAQF